MTMSLHMNVNLVQGVLVRVLGLVERRGYQPVSVAAERHGTHMTINLTVESSRPVEQLARQLRKLHDVNLLVVEDEAEVVPGAARG